MSCLIPSSSTLFRKGVLVFSLLAVLLGMAAPLAGRVMAQDTTGPYALSIKIDGVINPVKERYIGRAIEEALVGGAELLVIKLDTPGGRLDSTREIVELLLDSPVPVAVYVHPRGARAGSAGTFITAAANFAVMAPGSNIGAATPVSSTGQDLDETLASKVENDAAALIRSIAQERGRNEELLAATVHEAASYTAQEAVEGNVVDFIADDISDLLDQLNGRTAETSLGPVELTTAGLADRKLEKNLLESILEFLADPNVSFLLLSIGGLGIVIELFNPGLLVPVIVGVLCLILAFVGLGNLPVNWAGVVLILLAIVLAAAEVVVAGFGVLGIASIASLVIGAVLLFARFGDSLPGAPDVSVSPWVIAGVAIVAGVGVVYLGREAVKSRRERGADLTESIVGKTGSVAVAMDPRGSVRVANDTWSAVSEDGGLIETGERVQVVSIDGLVLTVVREEPSQPTGP